VQIAQVGGHRNMMALVHRGNQSCGRILFRFAALQTASLVVDQSVSGRSKVLALKKA
jgi:hypothetical protein